MVAGDGKREVEELSMADVLVLPLFVKVLLNK